MSEGQKLYIAGIGMITPVGANTAMTVAAVKAGVSAYAETEYYGQRDQPITMASVPTVVFDEIDAEIGEGDRFNLRHDRVVKMAVLALREACALQSTKQPIPLVLAMPEGQDDSEGLVPLVQVLEQNCKPWVHAQQCRSLHSGRAAGLEAIEFAFRYLYDLPGDFFMIGGSDSYRDYARLNPLSEDGRLRVPDSQDGFAPGEAACFILLTRKPEFALARRGHIIALHPPGIADEPGHLYSEEAYRGDGLDRAFKKALSHRPQPAGIHRIFSSMNGESHWAKEYGVAFTRNRDAFHDPVGIEHPADCYGDLGAATGPVLIALAAEQLLGHTKTESHLVYSSSDHGRRGAIVVEKMALANAPYQPMISNA